MSGRSKEKTAMFCGGGRKGEMRLISLKRKIYRAILWVITLCVMVMMFGFSAQDQTQSGSLSAKISAPLTSWIARQQGGLDAQDYQQLYKQVDWYVRKTAHFSEYALLGMLLTLLLDAYRLRWRWVSWLICTAYAATDEIHQLFSDGRTGRWQDVMIDSAGALTGLLVVLLLLHLWQQKRQKNETKNRRNNHADD